MITIDLMPYQQKMLANKLATLTLVEFKMTSGGYTGGWWALLDQRDFELVGNSFPASIFTNFTLVVGV